MVDVPYDDVTSGVVPFVMCDVTETVDFWEELACRVVVGGTWLEDDVDEVGIDVIVRLKENNTRQIMFTAR